MFFGAEEPVHSWPTAASNGDRKRNADRLFGLHRDIELAAELARKRSGYSETRSAGLQSVGERYAAVRNREPAERSFS